MTSLLAKRHFDVPRVVARNNYPENRWLFSERWGVDFAVSASATRRRPAPARPSTCWPIMRTPAVPSSETTIKDKSAAVGQTLADIALPPRTVVATVIRDGEPHVPGGSFALQAGDEVILVSEHATEAEIQGAFQRRPPS